MPYVKTEQIEAIFFNKSSYISVFSFPDNLVIICYPFINKIVMREEDVAQW